MYISSKPQKTQFERQIVIGIVLAAIHQVIWDPVKTIWCPAIKHGCGKLWFFMGKHQFGHKWISVRGCSIAIHCYEPNYLHLCWSTTVHMRNISIFGIFWLRPKCVIPYILILSDIGLLIPSANMNYSYWTTHKPLCLTGVAV